MPAYGPKSNAVWDIFNEASVNLSGNMTHHSPSEKHLTFWKLGTLVLIDVLGHLEQMRVNCVEQDDMSIFNMECMQKSLQLAQSNSSDSLRRQYSDLFLLAWEDELPISRRARKLVSNSLPLGANLHSSNEDSEEEEIVKPKQAKRRKKAISDSD